MKFPRDFELQSYNAIRKLNLQNLFFFPVFLLSDIFCFFFCKLAGRSGKGARRILQTQSGERQKYKRKIITFPKRNSRKKMFCGNCSVMDYGNEFREIFFFACNVRGPMVYYQSPLERGQKIGAARILILLDTFSDLLPCAQIVEICLHTFDVF